MFDQNLIFIAENLVYKLCNDVCNDIILIPQFLEVVRQPILGAAGKVTLCCCKFNRLFSSERISKIGQDLTKLSSQ